MKKMSMFILFLLMIGISICSTTAFAASNKTLILKDEEFKDFGVQGQIYRHYEDKDTKELVYYNIYLPDEIYQKVKNTDNPLLEAKKELTTAYRYFKTEKKLSELNGTYLNDYPDATIRVSSSYNDAFQQDVQEANQYADNQLKLIADMSSADREKVYASADEFDYVDYGKEIDAIRSDIPKEQLEAMDKDAKAVGKTPKKSVIDKESEPVSFYIMIGFIVLVVVVFTVYIFRKRG